MLFLLFLFFLFRGYGTEAVTILSRAEVSPNTPLMTRTMFDVIWGCLSTTFICAWVSVHPNVPPPTHVEFGWRSLVRRCRLMFWTLVAPEFVLFWAVRQWKAAGEVKDLYNRKMKERKVEGHEMPSRISGLQDWFRGRKGQRTKAWTRAHGHLVIMGGIVLNQPNTQHKWTNTEGNVIELSREGKVVNKETEKAQAKVPTILDMDLLEKLLENADFEIYISEEDIEDKAKGDFLSKAIAILQVSWFIIQCVARFVQGLAVTELEVVTLALASLNGIMYSFWWNKPLGLGVPFKLCFKHEEAYNRKTNNIDDKYFSEMLEDIPSQFDKLLTRIAEIPDTGIKRLRWFVLLPFRVLAIIFFPFFALIQVVFGSIGDVIGIGTIGATHVPAFYCPETESFYLLIFVVIPLFGIVFGGIHCIAWNFTYPSHAEKLIWRVASLVITLTPILPDLIWLVGKLLERLGSRAKEAVAPPLVVFSFLQISLYVLARVVLLVEAVILLRKQPTTALQAVDWTKFIPHL